MITETLESRRGAPQRCAGTRACRTAQVVVAAMALLPASAGAQVPAAVQSYLEQEIGFTAGEIRAVGGGAAVTKLLQSAHDREVTVAGVVRVQVPRSFFAQRNVDLARSLRAASRLALGIFSDTARSADVSGLRLGPDDVADVKACRAGDCDMKLPATVMTELPTVVDLSASDAAARLTTYARGKLADLAAAYRGRGDAALPTYADRGSVSGAAVFQEMLGATDYLYRYLPSLHAYLRDYPRSRLPGATEAIYWSVDQLPRMKRVVRLNHVVVYTPGELESATVVATKLLYANHYFEAGLEVLTALDGEAGAEAKDIVVLQLRRYRFDQLPGGILNIRRRVSEGLRDQTRADLQALATEYQDAWSRAPQR